MCIRWLINFSDSTKMHGATIRFIIVHLLVIVRNKMYDLCFVIVLPRIIQPGEQIEESFIHTYIHKHIHIYIHIHTYIHTYIHTHTHIHAYIYVHLSVSIADDNQLTSGTRQMQF